MARNKNPEITINRILDTSMELFFKKGYEKTTIQDIVDALGDLSKGAIYHHFKSKEEIMEAIIPRLYSGAEGLKIEGTTGLEKIKSISINCLKNPGQQKLVKAAPNLMKNPKFFTEQIFKTVEELAPKMIAPIIEEGMRDGSIKTNNPEELAEIFLTLLNVWLNPTIFNVSEEKLQKKYYYLKDLLEKMGLPILDEEVLEILQGYRGIIEKEKSI